MSIRHHTRHLIAIIPDPLTDGYFIPFYKWGNEVPRVYIIATDTPPKWEIWNLPEPSSSHHLIPAPTRKVLGIYEIVLFSFCTKSVMLFRDPGLC